MDFDHRFVGSSAAMKTAVRPTRPRRVAERPRRARTAARTAATDTKNETQAYRIRAAIELDIVSGALRPGAKLDEETLAKRYGASRTPVREALKHLASERLVELRPHAGAFVMALSVTELAELFETMAFLESACAALASRRHTTADREALTAAHDACAKAARRNDPDAFNTANTRFHECVYRASHNGYLESTTLALRNRLEAYRREATFHPGLMALTMTEHERILESILQMDEGAALTHMRTHLDTMRNDAVSLAKALPGAAGRR
jgi:DNA-binding GntR family transcriptional regulator